jgi:hypothetical protein
LTAIEALVACGAFRTLHPQLYQVAMAIQEHEGFFPRRGPNKPGSKAWRNNNPGNLRKSVLAASEEDGFAVFGSYYEGLLGLLLDLAAKATGRTSTNLGPWSTLRQLITTWAPPEDNNDTDAYVRAVALRANVSPEVLLASLYWS